MANFEARKISLSNINNGVRYQNGDVPDAEAINAPIEASFYAQEFAEALAAAPDVSEAGNTGTPSVTLVQNGAYKKFKFANLRGAKGDKGDKGNDGTAVPVVNATSEDGLNYTATVPGFSDYNLGQMIVLIPDRACAAYDAVLNINDIGYRRIYLDCEGGYQTSAYYGWLAQNKPVLMVLSMDNTTGTQYWAALTNDLHHRVLDRRWLVNRFEIYNRSGGDIYVGIKGIVNQTQRTFQCTGTMRFVNVTNNDAGIAIITKDQLCDLLRETADDIPYVTSCNGVWWANVSGVGLTEYGTKVTLSDNGLHFSRAYIAGQDSSGNWSATSLQGVDGSIIYFTIFGEIA